MPTGIYPRKKGKECHNWGRKHTEKWKENMSERMKKWHKMGTAPGFKKGNIPNFTPEWKRKLSERQMGEKNHAWKDGLSKKPYPLEWTRELTQSIRKRDKFICQICKKHSKNLDVHHIDYDKQNCNLNNLITLCHSCHSKTNFSREDWTQYFQKKLK